MPQLARPWLESTARDQLRSTPRGVARADTFRLKRFWVPG